MLRDLKNNGFKDSLEYETFSKSYDKKYYLCGKLGVYYDPADNLIKPYTCGKWECVICRPKLKYLLHLETVKNVYNFDLQKHFIITSDGETFRKDVSWDNSYKYMNLAWPKLRKTICRKYGKLIFIVFPRAQKDGYCHYHILTQKWMSWSFLNEKRKNYGLGFVSIQKNKDTAEYLSKDYFKDNEWKIPFYVKRFRTSREIILRNYVTGGITFKNSIVDLTGNNSFDEKMIMEKFGIKVDIEKIKDNTIIDNLISQSKYPEKALERAELLEDMLGSLRQYESRIGFTKSMDKYYKW